jgi:hypothetical protein
MHTPLRYQNLYHPLDNAAPARSTMTGQKKHPDPSCAAGQTYL